LLGDPVTLLGDPVTLLNSGSDLTPLPVGNSQKLIWQGGNANDDPTVAANWNPNVAPMMAANQELDMGHGTMNLGSGNLAANQLNDPSNNTAVTATINLTAGGSLDLNIPALGTPNVDVNMKGGGTGVLNVFSDPKADPNIAVNIDHSTLDLQANMSFGKLAVSGMGGTAFLQGDSHLNGTSVTLNTGLDGFGSVELASSGTYPGRMDLSAPLPAGVTVTAEEHTPGAGANGLVFENAAQSTTPGGLITLDDGFVKLRDLPATSYTQTGNEFDFFNNGTKIDALDIVSGPGFQPLQVASNANGIYVYNADPSAMPLGAGTGLGGGGGGGMQMALVATPDAVGPSLSPLPMHS
jgi:hypothetical protein